MEALIEVLEDTPWWVYLVFFWLIFSGVQAMRPRTVPMVKLFILPTLLVLWSFHGVFIRWEGNWIDVCYWIISLGAGAFLGWWMIHKWKIYVDRSRKTLMLPGTKSTLWLAPLCVPHRYHRHRDHRRDFHRPNPQSLVSLRECSLITKEWTKVSWSFICGPVLFVCKRYK